MDRFLLDSSRGLAEMTRGKFPTVQFIHESVKEYLLNTGLMRLEPKLPTMVHSLSHERLSYCCDRYLMKSEAALLSSPTDGLKEHMTGNPTAMKTLRDQIAMSHPFLGYATDDIIHHAELARSRRLPQDTFIVNFPLELWRKFYNMTRIRHSRRQSDSSTRLYVLISADAPKLASLELWATLSKIEDHETNQYYESLLGTAVDNGNLSLAKLLLDHGSHANSIATWGYTTCLSLAIKKQDSLMVKLLINAGADPTAACENLQSHLFYALHVPLSLDVIEMLLTLKPYSTSTSWFPEYTKALQIASSDGHNSVKDIIFTGLQALEAAIEGSKDEQIDIVAYSQASSSQAFIAACIYNRQVLIKLLLRRMPYWLSENTDFLTTAVRVDNIAVVQTLLENNVAVNTTFPESCDTALILASRLGHREIVKLTLEHNADINRFNSVFRTALHEATASGHIDTLRILLSSGADPNVRWGQLRTPILHLAMRERRDEIVHELLDLGDLDVNVVGGPGEHAITVASRLGRIDYVQALLIHDIPPEHLGRARVIASVAQHHEIVEALSAKGARAPLQRFGGLRTS